MKVHLGIVVASHLRDITDDYLDYLWKEIEKGLWGMSFDKYNYETTNK